MGKNLLYRFLGNVCLVVVFVTSLCAQQEVNHKRNALSAGAAGKASAGKIAQSADPRKAMRSHFESLQQKLQKMQQGAETGKKIFRQLEDIQRIDSGRAKAVREQTLRQSITNQSRKRVTLLGQPTDFCRAPFAGETRRVIKAKGVKTPSLASAVLVNGQQHDTVQAGDSYDITFSFSPGYISAIMDVYIDSDDDGIIGENDIALMKNALLMDNGQNDLDGADGSYRYRIKKGDALCSVAGNLIFQVNDYQSVSSARVTIKPRPSISVFTGKLKPAFKGIVARLSTQAGVIYACSDSTGTFSSPIAIAAPYQIYLTLFDVSGTASGYLMPRSQYIRVDRDTSTASIDLSPATSFIEGNVRDYEGNSVPNATVSVYGTYYYYVDLNIYPPPYEYQYATIETRSDSLGHYRIGLTGGRWTLYPRVDWTNQYLTISSQSVIVPSSGTILVDLTIPKSNAAISGKVVLGSSGIGGVTVYAYSGYLSNIAISDADGKYSVPVFDLGTYSASVSLSDAGYAVDTSYKHPLPPDTSGVDFSLSKVKGGVSGKITNAATGAPVANAMITFSGPNYITTMSDDSGRYRAPLKDGTYYVYISAAGYFYYYDYNVYITGQIVTKNYALSPAASVTGKVTNNRGVPLAYASVTLYDNYWSWMQSAYTDFEGNYCFNVVTPGDYKLQAQASGYLLQWYDGKSDFSSANVVHVHSAAQTAGIDFSLTRGGTISGIVKNKSGQPISYAYVTVYDSSYCWSSYATTNDSGQYIAYGLKTGKYLVLAYNYEYTDTWYDGKASFQTATPVPVVLDHETSNINFTLSRGASVSGTITNKSQTPLTNGYVTVFDTSLNYVAAGYCDNVGKYKVTRINPGPHYAMAQAYMYAQRWYKDAASVEAATVLMLQDEVERTGIDFVLPSGGSIAGTVSDFSGKPLPWAGVYALSLNGTESRYASASSDGTYFLSGLSSAGYFVEAYSGSLMPQWYDHKSGYDQADTVHVVEDSIITGINFNLSDYMGVFGFVLNDSTSAGAPDIIVEAINITSKVVSSTITNSEGYFHFSTKPGNYKIRAYSWPPADYVMAYYSSAGTATLPSQAEVISVADSGSQRQVYLRLHPREGYRTLTKSRLSLVVTNCGRLGTGDTLLPNGRWPDLTSKNYLLDGSLVFGASSSEGQVICGTLPGHPAQFEWTPLWNYTDHVARSSQTIETFFTGSADTMLYFPELAVAQKVYAFTATDYAIITYKIYYGGTIFGQNLRLNDVYVAKVLHFAVSNGKDIARKTGSNNLVFVCDSSNRAGVNIGATVLKGSSVKLGWWRVGQDPPDGYALYSALKTGATSDESSPASDYRVFVSSGPYTINSGDSITFSIALLAAAGGDSLASVASEAVEEYKLITLDVKPPDGPSGTTPSTFALYQNYPNPFNPSTNVRFDLKEASSVKLIVYNVLGQRVEEWNLGSMAAGRYGKNISMERHPSGVYFYSVDAVSSSGERFNSVKKMMLVK